MIEGHKYSWLEDLFDEEGFRFIREVKGNGLTSLPSSGLCINGGFYYLNEVTEYFVGFNGGKILNVSKMNDVLSDLIEKLDDSVDRRDFWVDYESKVLNYGKILLPVECMDEAILRRRDMISSSLFNFKDLKILDLVEIYMYPSSNLLVNALNSVNNFGSCDTFEDLGVTYGLKLDDISLCKANLRLLR